MDGTFNYSEPGIGFFLSILINRVEGTCGEKINLANIVVAQCKGRAGGTVGGTLGACVFHQQLDQSHCATLCLSVVKIGYIFIKTIAIRVHSNCGTRVTQLIYVGTNNVIQWGDR